MPDNSPTRRRRWFRFGLRTMFVVVTVFSLWLGWQAKIVRERKEAIVDLRELGVRIITKDDWLELLRLRGIVPGPHVPKVPRWRSWLGDVPVREIYFGGVTGADRDHAIEKLKATGHLFPEAFILPK